MDNLLYQSLSKNNKNGTAILYMGKTFTFKTVLKYADMVAATLLKCGLKKGEVVTVALPNIPEAAYCFYGINKAGGIAHMSHPLLPPKQLQAQMTLTCSRFLFALESKAGEFAPVCKNIHAKLVSCSAAGSLGALKNTIFRLKTKQKRPLCDDFYDFIKISQVKGIATVGFDPHPLADTQTSILLNSGGTGGEPKTVELSSFALEALCKGSKNLMWQEDPSGKFMLSVLPYFHGFGLAIGLHLMVQHGGCNVMMPRFNRKAAINYLKHDKINYIVGVPTLYNALLTHPKFAGKILKNIETAFVGGDMVPQKLLDDFNIRLKESGSVGFLFEGYGLTEAVTVAACNNHKSNRLRSVGLPIEGVKIKTIVTDAALAFVKSEPDDGNSYGEICISGDTLMNGYFNDKVATEQTFILDENGTKFLKTGDYGYVDKDGYVFFKQRLKRILKVGGVSVFPAEIEQAACSVEGILQVCAFGIPDLKKGTAVVLAVETDLTDTTVLEKTLKSALNQNLNIDSVPKKIVFYNKLPLTALNKIDVNELVKSVSI